MDHLQPKLYGSLRSPLVSSNLTEGFQRTALGLVELMKDRLRLNELKALHATLSPRERDELLECLLISAALGGDAVIRMLDEVVLCHSVEEFCRDHAVLDDNEGPDGC